MRAVPQFANIYAAHLNAFWVNTLGRLSSLFGFSVVEFLIYLLIILAVILVVRVIRGNIIRLGNGKIYGKDELLLAIVLASVIFFLFECNQDMYFYRTTFSKTYGIGQGSYTTDELETVCRMLAENVNALSTEVTRNEDGLMQCDADIRNRTRLAMTALGEKYPYLGGWFPKAKPVTVSELLSYSNMTGIYSAYTIEANYNTDMTPYNIPYTMCHELSHLKGVMQENQANFCAYLACTNAEDPDILYSGYLMAWVYCGNELYRRDYDRWKEISGTLEHNCNIDLSDNNAFWAKHEGKVSEATESFNDSWLKAHGQTDGTLSYDKVVDLIISYESMKAVNTG
ncbi:MAG TPA: DUF3810 domain-containing protein [Lachnospiraceae bacterium]|nr:DUF3810 domain-containing protein [Lachnospiraceae bacterium]